MSLKSKILRKRRHQLQLFRTRRMTSANQLKRRNWIKIRWLNLMHRRLPWLAFDDQIKTQQELFN